MMGVLWVPGRFCRDSHAVLRTLRCCILLASLLLFHLFSAVLFSSFFQQHLCLFFFFFMKSSAISCFLATILYPFLPVPLPTTPNPQFFLSMVLSLSLVIMVQITGSGEAPRLGRGGDQTLQAGLCQQGRQPAAADRTQGEAAVSKSPVSLPDCHKIELWLHSSNRWLTCRQQLETDLKIERQWRQTLQNDLDREKDTVAQLSTEAMQISALKKVQA